VLLSPRTGLSYTASGLFEILKPASFRSLSTGEKQCSRARSPGSGYEPWNPCRLQPASHGQEITDHGSLLRHLIKPGADRLASRFRCHRLLD